MAFQRHYKIISLKDYIDYRKHKKSIPPKALIITFDDGYKSQFDLLEKIKKYNVPVTIFLCSGLVGTNRMFWYDTVFSGSVMKKIYGLPNQGRLAYLKEHGFEETKEFLARSVLNEKEIQTMSPYVNFQSHGCFHPFLPRCDDQTARKEICDSKYELSQRLSLTINAFAYPNGDYSNRDMELVKEAGYEAALTTAPFYNSEKTHSFRLRRLNIPELADVNEALVKASGLWTFLRCMFFIDRGGKYVQKSNQTA